MDEGARRTTRDGRKLARLATEIPLESIDLLYVHWWDFTTSIPELMQSLNAVVNSGKVLYLGISDTPAWVVSKANECKCHLVKVYRV